MPTSTGRPDASVLSLREMAIDVGIARGYARVNVRQVFENQTGSVQEGTYRFRLPPSASIGDFAVWDGLVRIPGVILEKQRARTIYRELTTQRIDPGLLQQGEEDAEGGPSARPSGGAAFSVRVSPIPAWATKRLELQFQQEVPFVRGQGEFRLGLAPPDGEPPVAASLSVGVSLLDETLTLAPGGWPTDRKEGPLVFTGANARLDRDLVVRLAARDAPPLRLSAFRNPEGTLPDGLALAPWERPSEIPPEKDGFFLLELMPPAAAPSAGTSRPAASAARPWRSRSSSTPPCRHRWSGLETSYARLVRVLQSLGRRTASPSFPSTGAPATGSSLQPARPEAIEAALGALRARPLAPGTDVAAAVAEARTVAGDGGRLLLLTDGPHATSKALADARGPCRSSRP